MLWKPILRFMVSPSHYFDTAGMRETDDMVEKIGDATHKHLSDHRPILLREIYTDFGATPFRLYHSWFNLAGFDHLVTSTWNSIVLSDCNDNSLWGRVISTIHGPYSQKLTASHPSLWNSIIKEIQVIKLQGIDIISHCKIRIGNGMHTQFWNDFWIGDSVLKDMFPRLYSLENCKDCYVADKILSSITTSFRRPVRGGPEAQQLSCLLEILEPVILSNMEDRWVWDMNGNGVFRVKDVRNLLDDTLLPKDEFSTRWVKCVPIKINVFAWKIFLDRLPTRLNLYRRGVVITSVECPNCDLLSVLILTGSSGSKLFEWVQKRKTFWKGSFTLLGGAFGVTEIISCLRIRSLGKIIFLTM
ncbi:RNA-directed DNA polymerase, eukaryota [Tanacetum coccineum]